LIVRPTATLALCLLVAIARPASAQAPASQAYPEYAVKAAYLYNFGRYVQWPAQAFQGNESPLVIGVLGSDRFGGLLDEMGKKTIEGHPISVRRFASMADYKPCHILFVAASATAEDKSEAIKVTQRASVLVVGEEAGFAEQGGVINFLVADNKVHFEINREAAKREQLKISSKLLGLAHIVGEAETTR